MNAEWANDNKMRLERILLQNIRHQSPQLQALLERVNCHWAYEDGLYRFYYQSFKVYGLQQYTLEIITALTAIAPEGKPFTEFFQQVTASGTGRKFAYEVNDRWIEETAPIVQAFLHARYFLEMAIKYATLDEPPQPMPSGWAGMLCLFDIR